MTKLAYNTGRLTQYKFNINAQLVIGNLTWNGNGTLRQLAITDPLNAADAQTCTYGYDDLARLSSSNCGTAWNETFTFDRYGNLSKSGTVNFLPTYNAASNRFQTLPGATPTYDANGNLTGDGSHTYAWDAEGKAATIDAVGVTYDALGRMVERIISGVYTVIVYGIYGRGRGRDVKK